MYNYSIMGNLLYISTYYIVPLLINDQELKILLSFILDN